MDNLGIYTLALLLPTLWLLLKLSAPKDSPLGLISQGVVSLKQAKARSYFLSLLSVLLIDIALTAIDPWFTAWVGHDFSHEVFRIEGHFVARVQGIFSAMPARLFFVWIYVVVYPVLMMHLLLVLAHRAEGLALRRFWWAFVLNYTIALPFYFFFPVTEVGWMQGSGAIPILESLFPSFATTGRNFSGIDNCFPSLHTSLALTTALISLESGSKSLRWVCWISAGGILLSTLVLGIHWGLDLIAGAMHAALCVWLARRLARSPLPDS